MNKARLEKLAEDAEKSYIRKKVIEKVGSFAKTTANFDMKNAMAVAGIIGASVIVSQAVEQIIKYAKRKGFENASPEYFKKMLEKNPNLTNEDPEEVVDLWDTLARTAPNLAEDPIAAGGFITQNIQGRTREDHGGPTLDTYKMLADINKSFKDANSGASASPDAFSKIIAGAFVSPGGDGGGIS